MNIRKSKQSRWHHCLFCHCVIRCCFFFPSPPRLFFFFSPPSDHGLRVSGYSLVSGHMFDVMLLFFWLPSYNYSVRTGQAMRRVLEEERTRRPEEGFHRAELSRSESQSCPGVSVNAQISDLQPVQTLKSDFSAVLYLGLRLRTEWTPSYDPKPFKIVVLTWKNPSWFEITLFYAPPRYQHKPP